MILPIRCDLLTGGAPSHVQSKLAGEEVQLAETSLARQYDKSTWTFLLPRNES